MANVMAVNKSKKKGTRKTPQDEIRIEKDYGVAGYAHADRQNHRQVSLLAVGMTQIGKECHKGCAIREPVGDCTMPREGIFTKVIRGGTVKPGDAIKIVEAKARTHAE
jgi:hypothetical protein